jgi:hypothetical protein
MSVGRLICSRGCASRPIANARKCLRVLARFGLRLRSRLLRDVARVAALSVSLANRRVGRGVADRAGLVAGDVADGNVSVAGRARGRLAVAERLGVGWALLAVPQRGG